MLVVKGEEDRWDDMRFRFGVPYSKREETRRLYQSAPQKMKAIINHYVRSPTASWKVVAETLKNMKLYKLTDEVTAKYIKGTEVNRVTVFMLYKTRVDDVIAIQKPSLVYV